MPRGTLNEVLTIFPLRNDHALLDFTYNFKVSKDKSVAKLGVFPRMFSRLYELVGDLEYFELEVGQGRWNEQFAKSLNGYTDLQLMEGLDSNGRSRQAVMPGLTLSFNKLEDNAKLISFIDAFFSVSIFERGLKAKEGVRTVKDLNGKEFSYFTKPFEAFCSENLSTFMKLLMDIKPIPSKGM